MIHCYEHNYFSYPFFCTVICFYLSYFLILFPSTNAKPRRGVISSFLKALSLLLTPSTLLPCLLLLPIIRQERTHHLSVFLVHIFRVLGHLAGPVGSDHSVIGCPFPTSWECFILGCSPGVEQLFPLTRISLHR